jgi:hypothetical protein
VVAKQDKDNREAMTEEGIRTLISKVSVSKMKEILNEALRKLGSCKQQIPNETTERNKIWDIFSRQAYDAYIFYKASILPEPSYKEIYEGKDLRDVINSVVGDCLKSKAQMKRDIATLTPKQDAGKNHYFMQTLKREAPYTYNALKKALSCELVVFDTEKQRFDFRMPHKGCVGHFFKKTGYTGYKSIAKYILINGDETTAEHLKNYAKKTAPKSWSSIKKQIF